MQPLEYINSGYSCSKYGQIAALDKEIASKELRRSLRKAVVGWVWSQELRPVRAA
jgi:hypothetical protein